VSETGEIITIPHPDGSSDVRANIKIIDFDWSGKASEVYYPATRNDEIVWPGKAGGPIEQDHDCKLVNIWWKDEIEQGNRIARHFILITDRN
jgi:hypothetical protein